MALLLLSFSLLLLASSGDAFHEHASAVWIVGSVLCDRCVHQHESSFLSGATVAMECRSAKVRVEATSDEYGAFKIEVPSEIAHSLQLMRGCGVRLVKSPDENCRVKMKGESSSKALMAMALKSEEGGSYVYTAGSFMFHPTPTLCSSRNDGGFKDAAESEMKKKKGSSTPAVFPFLPLPPLVIPPLLIPPPPPSLPPLPPLPFLAPPLPLFPFPPLIPLIPPILPPLPFIPPLPPLSPSQVAHSQPTSP